MYERVYFRRQHDQPGNLKKVRETRRDDRDVSLESGNSNVYLRLGKKARAKRSGYECDDLISGYEEFVACTN
jgi:hypothetical protein